MSSEWVRSRLRAAAQAPRTTFKPQAIASRARAVRRRRAGAVTVLAIAAAVAVGATFVGAAPGNVLFGDPGPAVGPTAAPAPTTPTPREQPSVGPSEVSEATPLATPSPSPSATEDAPTCQRRTRSPADARRADVMPDLDGDGRPDTLRLDLPADDGEPVTLQAELDAGASMTVVLEDTIGSQWMVDVAGAIDLDGDGTEEALIFLGGNTALQYAVVTLHDCEFLRVEDEHGDAVVLVSGSSPGSATGARCDGEHVVVRAFEQAEGGPGGALNERHYSLEGGTLRLVDDRRTEIDAPPPNISTVCGA